MCFSSLALVLLTVAPFEPTPVAVPAALRERTSNPELSGLAWAAPLGKWLVVSDDTGLKGTASWHAPWVLALGPEGGLDAAPLPIAGLESLNDAESLAALPDGSFLLLTSHSPNKKGHVKAARCLLLHVGFEKGALRLLGEVDLSAAAPALATLAGAEGAAIDLEAVAVHDGAMFLGLKAPLDAKGRASIVRADGLDALLRSGAVDPAKLTRWAALDLKVDGADGTRVHQGVADLAFLPDGSVVLAANAPKGAPKDGGGALWKFSGPATGTLTLLRKYSGLKPEGLAVAADQKSLVVVFDTGDDAPLWAKGPLP